MRVKKVTTNGKDLFKASNNLSRKKIMKLKKRQKKVNKKLKKFKNKLLIYKIMSATLKMGYL